MRRHCHRCGEGLRLCVTREEMERNATVRIQCEHGHWNRVRACYKPCYCGNRGYLKHKVTNSLCPRNEKTARVVVSC